MISTNSTYQNTLRRCHKQLVGFHELNSSPRSHEKPQSSRKENFKCHGNDGLGQIFFQVFAFQVKMLTIFVSRTYRKSLDNLSSVSNLISKYVARIRVNSPLNGGQPYELVHFSSNFLGHFPFNLDVGRSTRLL